MALYRDPIKFIEKQKKRILAFRDGSMGSISEDLVVKTPVDTGAYAESHSISSNATAKRSVSSANREGKQNISKFQGIARSNLESDISSLGDDDFEIYAINGAPHASAVEHKHNYKVYTQTTRNANNHIADGIGKARSQ